MFFVIAFIIAAYVLDTLFGNHHWNKETSDHFIHEDF